MKHSRLTMPIAGALCTAALLAGCGREKTPVGGDAKAALTVTLAAPRTSDWPDQIPANGSIAAWQESVIGAEVGGLKLEEVLVNVGDTVTKGQLLARFRADTTRTDLAQVEATVAQAEANLTLARDRAERARRLDDTGTISHEDILQYNANEKTNAATLASATAQLESQRLKLLYTQVVAPDDGVISSRSATVGAVVNLGAELFKLIRQSRLEWRATVPADQLVRVAPGQPVALRLAGQPAVSGRVRQVSPVVDSGTLNGMVYVDLPEPGLLRSGMFVSGDIQFAETPALHVPEPAVVYRDGYQYLIKVDAAHRVRQIKVSLGRRLGPSVEILGSDLAAADRIVASGGSFLNEGDLVQVAPEETADVNVAPSPSKKGDRP